MEEDVRELRRRLEEAEETLRAIRSGEVDALVVAGDQGEQIFTLEGADHPYRTLIEAMQQGAVTLACNGTVLYCNHCFAEMLHVPHERLIGASAAEYVAAADRDRFNAMLRVGPQRGAQGDLNLQTAAGDLLPVYVAIAPLALVDATALCMVVTDLTEQKEHQGLQEASRRKDEFLAMLAHELRNPLAPIQNAVTLLQHLDSPDELVQSASEIIERQVQHLSRLVDDLLDVSRITLGKVKLQKEPVELASVLTRAVETIRPLIDARRHRLLISPPPSGLCVLADPTRLAQIIGNLLTNAAKYMEDGGEIVVSTEQNAADVEIRVRDAGMGIPPDLLPHVFELFTQGDRSLARSEGGLGIGLTLVRRLVEMHDGSVAAHSEGLGTGSEFVVRLPVLPAESASPELGRGRLDASASVRRSILVVDDNHDGANTLGLLLRMMGHDVRVAYNGPEALQAVDARPPQVVLLDIGLPGMSGHEVAQRLRATPGLKSLALIAMTGYGQEEDRQRSRDAGFDDHLVKPVNAAMLKRVLESVAV